MKTILKITAVLIFIFGFVACEKEKVSQEAQPAQEQKAAEKLSKGSSEEEIGKRLSEAIKSENWDEVDNILDSFLVPDEEETTPKILNIIDKEDLGQLKKQIKQLDEYVYIKTEHNDCIYKKVDLSITPLGYAVQKNKTEVVKFLLSQNITIDKGNYNKIAGEELFETKSPLFIAISEHNKEIAKLLISKGADVNFVYEDLGGDCESEGSSVLIEAVKWGDKEIVELLLSKGADVNQVVWPGDSKIAALDFAKSEEIKNILIKRGAKNSKYLE